MGDGDASLAGGEEGDETVEGTDEGGEAENLLGGGGVLAAEEVLLLEVGADGVDAEGTGDEGDADGSIIVVIATDAPLSDRNLRRLGSRAVLAIGRTGSPITNGSGDYVIAFSTAQEVRRAPNKVPLSGLANSQMSPLFQAAVKRPRRQY